MLMNLIDTSLEFGYMDMAQRVWRFTCKRLFNHSNKSLKIIMMNI